MRVAHQRTSTAAAPALWQAAREVRLGDTQLLGRLVRWRIPGTPGALSFDELLRRPPFLVLEEAEHGLVSGIVGRIWTLRRDYPELSDGEQFREWSHRGTARVVFGTWVRPREHGSVLNVEARVEALGTQGRLGVASVRPLVRGFQHLIGTDGMAAAVRRAERRPAQ